MSPAADEKLLQELRDLARLQGEKLDHMIANQERALEQNRTVLQRQRTALTTVFVMLAIFLLLSLLNVF